MQAAAHTFWFTRQNIIRYIIVGPSQWSVKMGCAYGHAYFLIVPPDKTSLDVTLISHHHTNCMQRKPLYKDTLEMRTFLKIRTLYNNIEKYATFPLKWGHLLYHNYQDTLNSPKDARNRGLGDTTLITSCMLCTCICDGIFRGSYR